MTDAHRHVAEGDPTGPSLAVRAWAILGGSLAWGATSFAILMDADSYDGHGSATGFVALLVGLGMLVWARRSHGPGRWFAGAYVGWLAVVAVASGGQCLGFGLGDQVDPSGGALAGFAVWMLGTLGIGGGAVIATIVHVAKRSRDQ